MCARRSLSVCLCERRHTTQENACGRAFERDIWKTKYCPTCVGCERCHLVQLVSGPRQDKVWRDGRHHLLWCTAFCDAADGGGTLGYRLELGVHHHANSPTGWKGFVGSRALGCTPWLEQVLHDQSLSGCSPSPLMIAFCHLLPAARTPQFARQSLGLVT